MASDKVVYCNESDTPFTVIKWKIRVGCQLLHNSVLLSYKTDDLTRTNRYPVMKYKSNVGGTVTELLAKEGDVVLPGAELLKLEVCKHPVTMKELCAECGADLRNLEKVSDSTTFSMVHIVPELKVSLEQADELGQDDENRLLESRKLVLLVDLDQTLIHTTNEQVPADLPGVHHFQLYGPKSPWYHTKIRPGATPFLESLSKYFELHICTFGARLYAHRIAALLDPDRKFFSHRILSRDECFDPTSKTGNLKALFPRGDHMVCIIDDREDVWNYAPNVVNVKPYCFFRNTGDINGPHLCDNSHLDDAKDVEFDIHLKSSKKEEQKPDKDSIKKKIYSLDCQQGPADGYAQKKCESFVDSADDYLLTLENILVNIHKHYYEAYDELKKNKETEIPDLKALIPAIRKTILKGCNIVFSSIIPTNLIAETSCFWLLAESLGSKVTSDLVLESDSRTTHVISSKLGTAKVSTAKKYGDIHIVNVNWLFSCAERWERLDENLYPLTKDIVPPFLDKHQTLSKAGKHLTKDKACQERGKRPRKKRPKEENAFVDKVFVKAGLALSQDDMKDKICWELGKRPKKRPKEENAFVDKVFLEAGLALSQDDIADMDREIEEACSDSWSESSDDSLSSSEGPKACREIQTKAQDN